MVESSGEKTEELGFARLLRDRAFREAYELKGVLGRGGMGLVAHGVQRSTGREVAVKILEAHAVPTAAERIVREGRLLARIKHPGILQVYDAGQIGDCPYLVLELATGGSLRDRLRAEGRLAPARTAELLGPCLDALGELHAAGVLHRDFKADNVVFDAEGRAKLADFGLARGGAATDPEARKLTESGMFLGTIDHTAPEVILGQDFSSASDVFAVGCTLHEMLTGHAAFPGATVQEVIAKIQREPARPVSARVPDLPEDVVALVARCLHADPAHRPDAVQLARAVATWSPVTASGSARPSLASATEQRRRSTGRRHAFAAALALWALGLIACAFLAARWASEGTATPRMPTPPADTSDDPLSAGALRVTLDAVRRGEEATRKSIPILDKLNDAATAVYSGEDLRALLRPVMDMVLPALADLDRRLAPLEAVPAGRRLPDDQLLLLARGLGTRVDLWYLTETCRRATTGEQDRMLPPSDTENAARISAERRGIRMLAAFQRAEVAAMTRLATSPALDGADVVPHLDHLFTAGHAAILIDWDAGSRRQIDADSAQFATDVAAVGDAKRPVGAVARGCWAWGWSGSTTPPARKSLDRARRDVLALAEASVRGTDQLLDLAARMDRELSR